MKTARSRFLTIRGLRYHLREWGQPGAPCLFLLHGFMDVGASFQFMVESLRRDWFVVAPDWRGFGRSDGGPVDSFWFPDYLGDLDAILSQYSPDRAVRLVGHSMGGNIASLYAGVRPERVSRLIGIDAYGLPQAMVEDSPERVARWLQQLRQPMGFRAYTGVETFATRLMSAHPRLSAERARFLAEHLGHRSEEGWSLAVHPGHRRLNPIGYRRDEAEAAWRRVTAKVLWILPGENYLAERLGISAAEMERARACFVDFRELRIPDCGHNIHFDQPEALALAIEGFLTEGGDER